MLYTIQNDEIQLTINSLGGEMMSLQTKKDSAEYLWQGNPTYWSGRAFHLFPICGRLKNGQYIYQGKTYEMGIHGFLRKSELKVEEHQDASITFSLSDTVDTHQEYPFSFQIWITYTVKDNQVQVAYKVYNPGAEPLIFTLGGHPGFQVPLECGLTFEDYVVEFEHLCQPQMLRFSEACLLTEGTDPFPLNENQQLNLRHTLFDDDAIFLQNMGTCVTLKSPKGKKSVTLCCEAMKYLGLWHKPKSDAPYLCLEPWLGIPANDDKVDILENKRDMIHLPPDKIFTFDYSISLL